MTHAPAVLFICHHNANRSQIAAGYLADLAGGRVRVLSAGPEPAEALNPSAVEVMAEEGIDIAHATPAQLTSEILRDADVVITLGCADAVHPDRDKRYEDWTLDTPPGHGMDAARAIRDQIKGRVQRLGADLLAE